MSHRAGPNPQNRRWLRAFLLSLLATLPGCDDDAPKDNTEALEPSPNATMTPSPLAAGSNLQPKSSKSVATSKPSAKRAATVEPPEPPAPLSVQQAPSADSTPTKAQTQLTLAGRLVWPSFPSVIRPGVSPRKGAEDAPISWRSFTVNARSQGRLQIRFAGPGFTFQDGTTIAARVENYGHFLVWPGERHYRVLVPGSGRALFTEGRADVSPMTALDPDPRAAGDDFGHPTRVWGFDTSHGKLQLHQAEIPETEMAGPLLCRFLLELISVAPNSGACDSGLVPVRAEFEVGRGKLVWETTELDVKPDAQLSPLFVPPREAQFREFGLPEMGEVMPTSERASLRKSGRSGRLTVYNPLPLTAWLLLDGLAVARVGPLTSTVVEGVSLGTYQARLVDFFGGEVQVRPNLAIEDNAVFGAPKKEPDSSGEL